MNITALYKKLNEGTISKDYFMKIARTQFPQYISPVTSFKDTVNILKGKRIISEAHKLNTDQIIDRLNPYHFRKGVEMELSKQKEINDKTYQKVKEKVAKKMQKNPNAYEDQVFANAKEVEKKDENLHTKEVKGGTNNDTKNAMKVKQKDVKANTRASKKENKKGNPRGVKHMTYNAKKAKGISQTMPSTGKEKVLGMLKEFLEENMISVQQKYNKGMSVETPDGPGTISEVIGGTLVVELENGNFSEYQINIVEKAMEKAREFTGQPEKMEEAPTETTESGELTEDQINQIVEKLLSKMKEAKDVVTATDETGETSVVKTVNQGQGKTAAAALKAQGITTAKSKTYR